VADSSVRTSWDLTTQADIYTTWAAFSDSDQFARVNGSGFSFTEEARPDGTVLRTGAMKQLGLTFTWDELPFQYRAPTWWKNTRVFHQGPAAEVITTLRLHAEGEGTAIRYTVEVVPRSALIKPMVAINFAATMKPKLERTLRALVAHLDDGAARFEPETPPMTLEAEQRLAEVGERLQPPEVAGALLDFIREAPLAEQNRMDPLLLARDWGLPKDDVVACMLQAAKEGILSIHWVLICPSCLAPKAELGGSEPHCPSCNITYDGSFPDSVAVFFRPAPAIRDFELRVDCIGSPARQPHVVAQDLVMPAEQAELRLPLTNGVYRLRTSPPSGAASLEVRPDAPPVSLDLSAEPAGLEPPLLRAVPGVTTLKVHNPRQQPVLVKLERRWRAPGLLTAGHALERYPMARQLLPAGTIPSEFTAYRGVVVAMSPPAPGDPQPLPSGSRLMYHSDQGLVAVFASPEEALYALRQLGELGLVSAGLAAGPVMEMTLNGHTVPMGEAVDAALDVMYSAAPGAAAMPVELAEEGDMRQGLEDSGVTLVPAAYAGAGEREVHWLAF
jgi:hypothetical protein